MPERYGLRGLSDPYELDDIPDMVDMPGDVASGIAANWHRAHFAEVTKAREALLNEGLVPALQAKIQQEAQAVGSGS